MNLKRMHLCVAQCVRMQEYKLTIASFHKEDLRSMAKPKAEIPVVFSAHHASADFNWLSHRCGLTPDQRIRYSDYGTNITVPKTGPYQIARYSRGLVDLNRGPSDPTLFPQQDFGKPERHRIWRDGLEPTSEERRYIMGNIYDRYHDGLLRAARGLGRVGLVVAWDNTAHYIFGNNEAGEPVMMQNIILSNGGMEGSAYPAPGETTTCDPALLVEFANRLRPALTTRGLCSDVVFNVVYPGGHIAKTYNTLSGRVDVPHPLHSFQVEYDTLITHDQQTLKPDYHAMHDLRTAFEEAFADLM